MENDSWLSKIREVLAEFSSREFQERVWLNGLGPEVSSYEEAMCKLFDDYGFARLIDAEWRQAGLNETQVVSLGEFRDRLLEFDEDIPDIPRPEDVLGRTAWADVRRYASKAARALKADTEV